VWKLIEPVSLIEGSPIFKQISSREITLHISNIFKENELDENSVYQVIQRKNQKFAK
jgi:hypothetical protein